jgi:hypothetical protein
LFARPKAGELALVKEILSPPQYELFRRMQLSEQAHAIQVCTDLKAEGYRQPDLLIAALLHDVGKIKARLCVWERVWIVLGKRLFPRQAVQWGRREAKGWRKAFVAAEKHAAWGAVLAEEGGASPLTVKLIRLHQDATAKGLTEKEKDLLTALQRVDDKN